MKLRENQALLEKMVTLRRVLHQYPELSWQETRTAATVGDLLGQMGIPFRRVAGTGIVADLAGGTTGPGVALRVDLDALPIQEETGLEFASRHAGLMHACGHDGHASMLLGAAELLARDKELPAPVRLIFQPAEEVGCGAQALIGAGVLDAIGLIFGGHLDRHYETGSIVVSDGAVNASTDTFEITITGQDDHAARPHESIDAVVVGSLMVMAIQTTVSREVNPAHPSVVTVGRLEAGTAANVIAARARLLGTIRAQEPAVRAHLKAAVRRIAEAVGHLHGAQVNLQFTKGTPAVINTPVAADLARWAAAAAVGHDGVLETRTANMGGEDFSYYLEKVPGCYVRFGAQLPGREGFPAHSSQFDFDEQALAVGAAYFHAVAHLAGRHLRKARARPVAAGAAER